MSKFKRIAIVAFVSIFFSSFLFASMRFKFSFSPSVLYDNSPTFFSSTEGTWAKEDSLDKPIENYWEKTQDSIRRFDDRLPLLSGGFEIESDNILFAIKINIKEELYNFLSYSPKSNIPYIGNTKYAVTNAQYPTVAFLDYKNSILELSIGRRLFHMGPGEYSFILSPVQPYLDHFFSSLSYHKETFALIYDFYALSSSNSTFTPGERTSVYKTFFIHKTTYERKNLIIALSELNCVYDAIPTLADFTSFVLWHNQYQEEHSNVMIELSFETKIKDIRLYGLYAQDDICLKNESDNLKPTALGFALGLDWQIKKGNKYLAPSTKDSDYIRHEKNLKEEGGLHLSFESYFATNWLYNRREQSPEGTCTSDRYGKITLPYRFYSSNGGYTDKIDAYYLGFPFGPGSIYLNLKFSSEEKYEKLSLSFSTLFRGDIDIDTKVEKGSKDKWLELQGDIRSVYFVTLETDKVLESISSSLALSFSLTLSMTNEYHFTTQGRLSLIYGI